ncbi:YibE/F family protein [uncultured Limosilactobacillus sp.]|uniref:YibE/F family protein n=1 Tax=uncultured Limosilactobacillus sp. TaxID=2837629 RepID=UPI0025FD5A41|nr:YibE/F family protein [uncultured Limosilactobacillus sp.]
MFDATKRFHSHITFKIMIALLIGGFVMFFVHHDQVLYHQPIAKITKVTNGQPKKQVDEFKNHDQLTHQKITATILNGRYRGQTVHLNNAFTNTHATDQQFHVGNQVFVNHLNHHQHRLTGNINSIKRDAVVAFLAWLVAALLILLMGYDGLKTLCSVILNTGLFILAIWLERKISGNAVLIVFGLLTVGFATASLLIVLGPNKKMLATLAATILGTFASLLLGILILGITHSRGVIYESMQYVTQVPQTLFLAELMLGSLGAVMDECSDIIATLFELHQLNPMISRKQLFSAGQSVGSEIMGPLINVLFLVFMTGTFASSILYLKNGNGWGYTFSMNMSLGMTQSLVSGIGIAIVVPIVSAFGALLLGRKES